MHPQTELYAILPLKTPLPGRNIGDEGTKAGGAHRCAFSGERLEIVGEVEEAASVTGRGLEATALEPVFQALCHMLYIVISGLSVVVVLDVADELGGASACDEQLVVETEPVQSVRAFLQRCDGVRVGVERAE